MQVPVVDSNRKPLMPTSPVRARKLIKSGEATPFFSNGVFCIRLNREPSDRKTQTVVVGVDPGSKREGYCVRSEKHDFLNVDADAKDYVGKKVQARRDLRKHRRKRKTPCRARRKHNSRGRMRRSRKDRIPTGVRSRWEEKLRVLDWLSKLYPTTHIIVEDIRAPSLKGQRLYNKIFNPLETGKNWFYDQIKKREWILSTIRGYDTSRIRHSLNLSKMRDKRKENFYSHCVDAWVLAWTVVGGKHPQHENILRLIPLMKIRRQLHYVNYIKGGIRHVRGGTNKGSYKHGTLINAKGCLWYIQGIKKTKVFTIVRMKDHFRTTITPKKVTRVLRPLNWYYKFISGGESKHEGTKITTTPYLASPSTIQSE